MTQTNKSIKLYETRRKTPCDKRKHMNHEQVIDKLLEQHDQALFEKRWEQARQLEIAIEAVIDDMKGDTIVLKDMVH